MTLPFIPRPSQARILKYHRGRFGISAVPGSGKTHTLSALAASLIASGRLEPEQEVLIVTLVNSAVENFASRIGGIVVAGGLIPQLGYRVRTLHGLAHDIVREDPPLVNLDKQFSIVDETASSAMIRDAARAWIHLHPEVQDSYLMEGLDEHRRRRINAKDWPELVESLAVAFIRSAKDHRLAPEGLRAAAGRLPGRHALLEMGLDIYADYQRALAYRGAVDFDDLIRLAAEMLASSGELLQRLRYRWPYILEDEAQDSSELQEEIITALVGEGGNWVRVGDPNQAIFETFTTANPHLLRRFIEANPHQDMPESGRSQSFIIELANFLIDWTMKEHPSQDVRDALSPPHILPAPPGDPQPNPQDNREGIVLVRDRLAPDQEVEAVVRSIASWLPDHADATVAVLSSTNEHAARVAEALKRRGIPYRELLRSTSPTRAAAGALSYVLGYLAEPESSTKLAQAYKVWRRDWRASEDRRGLYDQVARNLARWKQIENYVSRRVAARAGEAELVEVDPIPAGTVETSKEVAAELAAFREVVDRWHRGVVLPIDQLVLTVSQDIFNQPAELALAHKLAIVMRELADENPQHRLPELIPRLHEIARNERRFIGFSSDDAGFDPKAHKGVVVVATMHKAKGLEWDRVYLMSVNEYDFPSAQATDHFISEKWFVRDGLNLEAEALAQLRLAATSSSFEYYVEGEATRKARLDYVRERLRLLFVGITRARRDLILSWNTGRRGEAGPALPLAAIQGWWDSGPTLSPWQHSGS